MTERINPDQNEITFGIEIEIYVPNTEVRERGIRIGQYHGGLQLPAPFHPGWTAEEDGSIRNGAPYGYRGFEIVSPPLKGMDGLLQLVDTVNLLNEMNAKYNNNCGVHVHIGTASVLGHHRHNFEAVGKWVRNLVKLVSHNEHALYAIGNSTYRMRSHYCLSVKNYYSPDELTSDKKADYFRYNHRDRYRTLNLEPVFRPGDSSTVEFRIFAPTLNANKLVGYVMTAMGIAHKAAYAVTTKNFDSEKMVQLDGYRKALDNMHSSLNWAYRKKSWVQGAIRYGVSEEVWERFGADVLKNQRWNSERFESRAPRFIE